MSNLQAINFTIAEGQESQSSLRTAPLSGAILSQVYTFLQLLYILVAAIIMYGSSWSIK